MEVFFDGLFVHEIGQEAVYEIMLDFTLEPDEDFFEFLPG
jgi:hypothetical protein